MVIAQCLIRRDLRWAASRPLSAAAPTSLWRASVPSDYRIDSIALIGDSTAARSGTAAGAARHREGAGPTRGRATAGSSRSRTSAGCAVGRGQRARISEANRPSFRARVLSALTSCDPSDHSGHPRRRAAVVHLPLHASWRSVLSGAARSSRSRTATTADGRTKGGT